MVGVLRMHAVSRPASGETGLQVVLPARCVVGRGQTCDLVMAERSVSSTHAAIEWVGTEWQLRDLGSRNGTIVDEKRIAEPVPLVLESTLRVNEAGPVLRLEHVAAGAAYQAALVQYRDAPAVAHVRGPARSVEAPRGGVRPA